LERITRITDDAAKIRKKNSKAPLKHLGFYDLLGISLAHEAIIHCTFHQVEMEIHGWRGCEVEVVEVGDGKAKVFQLVVALVET
jgi:hypothetical protein